jgi:hypothetical protein
MTFRGPVPLASIPSPLSADRRVGLADNGGRPVRPADRSPEASAPVDDTSLSSGAGAHGPNQRLRRGRPPLNEANRESRYLTGLLAVRGLPFDTTYLQARIVAGYRKGGT